MSTPSWNKNLVFVQITATQELVNVVEEGLSNSSLAPSSLQSPSLAQQLRTQCCTCFGHQG